MSNGKPKLDERLELDQELRPNEEPEIEFYNLYILKWTKSREACSGLQYLESSLSTLIKFRRGII